MATRNTARLGTLAVVTALTLLGAACVAPGRPALAPPPPETPVWMAGDSLGWALASRMRPLPYTAIPAGAAGFTSYSTRKILDDTIAYLDAHPDPDYMLVHGGANDTNRGLTTEQITDGMEEFEDAMTARGIVTIWVPQPAWTRAAELDPLADWTATRAFNIDCRSFAGGSYDGVHPANSTAMAACVDQELVNLGIIWSN